MEITQGWIDNLISAKDKVEKNMKNNEIDSIRGRCNLAFLLGYINSAEFLRVEQKGKINE